MTMVMKISLLDAKSSIGFNNALPYTTRFSHTERMRKQHIVWPDKICEFMVAIILKAILDVENFSLLLTFSPSTSSYSRSYIKKKKRSTYDRIVYNRNEHRRFWVTQQFSCGLCSQRLWPNHHCHLFYSQNLCIF